MAQINTKAGEQSPALSRCAIEAEIERLIGLLDTADGDPDFEDLREDDEPSVSLTLAGRLWMETDLELDTADSEPSLGAPETVTVPGASTTPPSTIATSRFPGGGCYL